jgi:arylsulfatase A-like enzyme
MTSGPRLAPERGDESRRGALDVLLLSLWCGLAAGLLEVGTRVSCRAVDPTDRLYWMSRHFVWLTPLANMVLFFCLGLAFAAITNIWPRRGGWFSFRIFCALTLLPTLMVAVPGIFSEAWFVLALGIASRVVPWLERRAANVRSVLLWSFPALLGSVAILALSVFAKDWLKQRHEAARPLPPTDSPNVLFIVLDTVRLDHLSLHGYQRPTTPTLERLAKKGIRFDGARAPAPWTLASHASFFSGRWPHELGANWSKPIRTKFPLLAEYLGSHGYATAGLAANVYCSYDTGLDRGFAHYEDYVIEKLGFLRTAVLIDEVLKTLHAFDAYIAASPLAPLRGVVQWFYTGVRRDAESINRGFFDWLARRPESRRPFFVFLNYFDAHTPYKLPDGAQPRLGRMPLTQDERRIIYDNWIDIDKPNLPQHYLNLARDSYDNCLAYLDEQLGHLFDDLQRCRVLERTLVVITSDHGEGLGEHDLFDHGESLYSTEIRVPLLILLPSGGSAGVVVPETVSLRDLPATVVDLVGLGNGSPFPGNSLASLWRDSSRGTILADSDGVISELQEPNPLKPNQGRSPGTRGPLISVAEGAFVYIRNERDGTEVLFDERDDPRELTNRARADAFKPALERFRQRAARVKSRTPEMPR